MRELISIRRGRSLFMKHVILCLKRMGEVELKESDIRKLKMGNFWQLVKQIKLYFDLSCGGERKFIKSQVKSASLFMTHITLCLKMTRENEVERI